MLAYNHERFIAQAIEGVLSQECEFPIELIIGEDCSPDSTDTIVRQYQRLYPQVIRVITAKSNVGMHANSARCLAAARGEFVASCEGDDYWHHPKKLSLQVAALRDAPTAQLCHTDYDRRIGKWVLSSVHTRRKTPHLAMGAGAFTDLLHGMTIKTATTLYRREVLEKFFRSAFNRADWPFGDYPSTLFAATEGPIVYLPISTATYRLRPGSAMYSGREARLLMGQALASCREEFIRTFPVDKAAELRIRRVGRVRQMRDGFWAGDYTHYLSGHAWLLENGPRPNALMHALRLFALRTRFPLRIMQASREIVYKIVSAFSR